MIHPIKSKHPPILSPGLGQFGTACLIAGRQSNSEKLLFWDLSLGHLQNDFYDM
jgi:hypothetical protein